MASELEGIDAEVASAFATVFFDGTLILETVTPGATPLDAPTITTKSYACKVLEEEYNSFQRVNGQVGMNDVKVMILAKSLPAGIAPRPGARITSRSVTRRIVARDSGIEPVSTDPARAVWTCRAMGV